MSKNDNKIKELMVLAEKKKKALGKKPRATWRTNGVFKFNNGAHMNLNAVCSEDAIVDALAFALIGKSATIEACEILGVAEQEVEYNGYTLEDWTFDFKLRVSMIKWDKDKKKLDALEKKLNGLISEDAKTEMALEDIAKDLM